MNKMFSHGQEREQKRNLSLLSFFIPSPLCDLQRAQPLSKQPYAVVMLSSLPLALYTRRSPRISVVFQQSRNPAKIQLYSSQKNSGQLRGGFFCSPLAFWPGVLLCLPRVSFQAYGGCQMRRWEGESHAPSLPRGARKKGESSCVFLHRKTTPFGVDVAHPPADFSRRSSNSMCVG